MTKNFNNEIFLRSPRLFAIFFAVLYAGLIGGAGWAAETQPTVLWGEENVSNAANHSSPMQSQLISDGSGGVIMVWRDDRNYNPAPPPFPDPMDPGGFLFPLPVEEPKLINIYAQHLNSLGEITWDFSGVPLSSAAGGQYFPQLVSDGNGGAIVVWEDYRSEDGSNSYYSDIYAQRIDQNGLVLWASDVAICSAVNSQEKPKITSDGSGGAIIVWQDFRSGEYEVYSQRINGDGAPQWAVDGVVISSIPNNSRPLHPEIISDGSDGAIIVWQDHSVGEFFIYAQKIDGNGAAAWEDNGVRVSSVHAAYQYVSRPVLDDSGGVFIVWRGDYYNSDKDLWAQRINANGKLQWSAEGARIPSSPSGNPPQMIYDENGGVIIAWEDSRGHHDIYAQRINGGGMLQWGAEGVPICTDADSQFAPQMTSDNMGGAIITWYDYRNYNLIAGDSIQGIDVYAQRIKANGEVAWKADGEEISTAKLHQERPKIVSDGLGDAVIIWDDLRAGSGVDIYAKGISVGGQGQQ